VSRDHKPADPSTRIVVRVGLEDTLERSQDLAHEQLMTVTWEGVIAEQQQAMMALPVFQPLLVAAEEVGHVVRHHCAAVLMGVGQQQAVVDAPQMCILRILYRDDVVASVAELFGDHCADHLIEQKPHPAPCRLSDAGIASPQQCLLCLVAAP
jgi:hypothetical protein